MEYIENNVIEIKCLIFKLNKFYIPVFSKTLVCYKLMIMFLNFNKISVYFKESVKYFLRSKFFIRKELKYLSEVEKLTLEESTELKEKIFIDIVKSAYENSVFYNRWYNENNVSIEDIKTLNDIDKLPILTRKIITENHKYISTESSRKLIKARTSGTTGSPLMIMYSYKVVKLEHAHNYFNRKKCGFTYGGRLLSFRGNLDNSITDLFVHISNTLYLSSFHIRPDMVDYFFGKMSNFQPDAIEGYPSSLYNFCVLLDKRRLSLSIPVCFTSSETLLDFQRTLIERVLNTTVYDHYGNTERTVSLSQISGMRGYCENKLYSHIEWHSTHLLTTSLINKEFPLIRYKVDDIVETECIDGNTIIKKIDGRIEDTVILDDGTKLGRLDHILKNVDNIEHAQITQSKTGMVDISYVPTDNFDSSDELTLKNNVDRFIGFDRVKIKLNKISFDKLLLSGSGKFRFVISDYKVNNES